MQLSDFYYDLPQELIAQDPLLKRDNSRLMVLDREEGTIEHKHFYDVISYLKEGDCLVINDTKVIPARLIGEKEGTGAAIEVLLLKRLDDCTWETLVKPGKKARVGARIIFGGGKLVGEVIDIVEEGNRIVRFEYEGIFEEILDELGQMPLPPYITHKLEDKNRYQTVYAEHEGSAAAPTAGLHFTKELLEEIKAKGIKIAHVTLHVGLGTFRPVKEDNLISGAFFVDSCPSKGREGENNVSNEVNFIIRAVPRVFKSIAMRRIYKASLKANTSTITNLGVVSVDDMYKEYIDRFHVVLSMSKGQFIKGSVISYKDTLVFTFSSAIRETFIQKEFFRQMVRDGIHVSIESNGVYYE